jgi:magnesium transporter
MQLSMIEKLYQDDLKNPNHPSIFFDHKDYQILIYRLFSKDLEAVNVTSHGYVIDEDNTVFYYSKEEKSLIKIEDSKLFYNILDALVDESMEKIEAHIARIEELEENVYENKDAIKIWFILKKEMLRMERILSQAIKTHSEFIRGSSLVKHNNALLTGFEDIEEHLNRIFRSCSINISKLDNIYSLYTTLANEKMNRTMFSLTVISAIFLPINLIVGFFGMNTDGLYFAGNPHATEVVTFLIASIFVTLALLFFLKRKSFF